MGNWHAEGLQLLPTKGPWGFPKDKHTTGEQGQAVPVRITPQHWRPNREGPLPAVVSSIPPTLSSSHHLGADDGWHNRDPEQLTDLNLAAPQECPTPPVPARAQHRAPPRGGLSPTG